MFVNVSTIYLQDMATEIILTLGEAFEVAYQIALRSQTPATDENGPARAQGEPEPTQGETDLPKGEMAQAGPVHGTETRAYKESTF